MLKFQIFLARSSLNILISRGGHAAVLRAGGAMARDLDVCGYCKAARTFPMGD